MQTALKLAAPAVAVPFDTQIRRIIPKIVPWLALEYLSRHCLDTTFPLNADGYWAEDYGAERAPEREGVKDLLAFLETSVGGEAVWKDRSSSYAAACEIHPPMYVGPWWRVVFWGLEGPPTYLQNMKQEPRVEITYWKG